MEIKEVVQMLAALAQEERLKIIKEIVKAEDEGICPCNLVEKLNLTNANLSFHLKELKNAGLVDTERKGKFIYYYAKCDLIKKLGDYLICDCSKHNGEEK